MAWVLPGYPALSPVSIRSNPVKERRRRIVYQSLSKYLFHMDGMWACVSLLRWSSGTLCVGSLGHSATLCNHTHIHSTHLHSTSVYPSLSAHTNTRVRPPRLEGNHVKATLCSQTAQCDRSGAPLTPTEGSVCVHFYAFVNRPSCILKCTERCSSFSLPSLSHSVRVALILVTPAQNHDVSHEQSADVLACPLSVGAPLVVLLC